MKEEECRKLLQDYFRLAYEEYHTAITEKGYGNREKGIHMMEKCRQKRIELEEKILSMV